MSLVDMVFIKHFCIEKVGGEIPIGAYEDSEKAYKKRFGENIFIAVVKEGNDIVKYAIFKDCYSFH